MTKHDPNEIITIPLARFNAEQMVAALDGLAGDGPTEAEVRRVRSLRNLIARRLEVCADAALVDATLANASRDEPKT